MNVDPNKCHYYQSFLLLTGLLIVLSIKPVRMLAMQDADSDFGEKQVSGL